MTVEFIELEEKPTDWPANAIEAQLENIWNCINVFKEEPNYKNKEILISLFSAYDFNQQSQIGLFRTTKYEVSIINSLFLLASFHQIYTLKVYLYELIGKKTRIKKMASWVLGDQKDIDIIEFYGLIPQLKLYYKLYQIYTIEKEMKFSEYLLEFANHLIELKEPEQRKEYTNYYISLINDLSYFRCKKISQILTFSRDEILLLFEKIAKLLELNNEKPTISPLKGVLMTCLSNYILKSRNNYNEDYICKYISPINAEQSIQNQELWISTIEKLNDEREQKVVSEIFMDEQWNTYAWAQNINLSPTRKYYVTCFSKAINDIKMKKEYGSCVYGYKNDRIAELISPIRFLYNEQGEKFPTFSQVISFDIIYDKELAIEELKFLCKIIDKFHISNDEKKNFLEEILQYWILSVKDEQWKDEKERRYIIFMYEGYDYIETNITNPDYLKIKTSLLLEPDFILGENPVKEYLKYLANKKRKCIEVKPYLFCSECLNKDFDIVITETVTSCPICGNSDVSIENH